MNARRISIVLAIMAILALTIFLVTLLGAEANAAEKDTWPKRTDLTGVYRPGASVWPLETCLCQAHFRDLSRPKETE